MRWRNTCRSPWSSPPPALAGWHDLDPDGDTAHYAIALPRHPTGTVTVERSVAAREVWVLRHEDQHGEDITLHASRQAGLSALAQTVLSRWDNITDQDDVPATPAGLTDQQAVDLYFRHRGELESYTLYDDIVDGDPTPMAGIGPHHLRVELTTPEGARIYQLFHQLTTEVQAPDGSWPGGDVVDVLTAWFTSLGFTLTTTEP